jgi:hypothetical protein
MPSSLSCINRCNVSSHVPGARFIEQSLQVAKNQILMSSSDAHMDCNKLFFVSSNLLSILFTLYEQILIPLVFLKPYILKVSFCLLLDVIKDIRKIAFKQEIFTI